MTDRTLPPRGAARPGPAPRSGHPAWYLLLLVPLLAVLYPPLYNRTDPTLLGIPFFYWYQLAVIPVSMLCTVAVHLATRPARATSTRPSDGEADR